MNARLFFAGMSLISFVSTARAAEPPPAGSLNVLTNAASLGVKEPSLYRVNGKTCGMNGKDPIQLCLDEDVLQFGDYETRQEIRQFIMNLSEELALLDRPDTKNSASGEWLPFFSTTTAAVTFEDIPAHDLRIFKGAPGKKFRFGPQEMGIYLRLPKKSFSRTKFRKWAEEQREKNWGDSFLPEFLAMEEAVYGQKTSVIMNVDPACQSIPQKAARARLSQVYNFPRTPSVIVEWFDSSDPEYGKYAKERSRIESLIDAEFKKRNEKILAECKANADNKRPFVCLKNKKYTGPLDFSMNDDEPPTHFERTTFQGEMIEGVFEGQITESAREEQDSLWAESRKESQYKGGRQNGTTKSWQKKSDVNGGQEFLVEQWQYQDDNPLTKEEFDQTGKRVRRDVYDGQNRRIETYYCPDGIHTEEEIVVHFDPSGTPISKAPKTFRCP